MKVKKYILFNSDGVPISPDRCTTAWDSEITCTIPLSGFVGEVFYNLMVMEGEEEKINNWLVENSGKVREVTKDEINETGRQIVPDGTEAEYFTTDGEKVILVAGKFDIESTEPLWTIK